MLGSSRVGFAQTPHAAELPYQLEVGLSGSYIQRETLASRSDVRYRGAWAPGILARATLLSWLRLSARYRAAEHQVLWGSEPLGLPAGDIKSSTAQFLSLDGYIHPTLTPVSRVNVWATFGVGWTGIAFPALQVNPPRGPWLRQRRGVLVQMPFGFGFGIDLIPRWLTLSYDALYESVMRQSGEMYERDRYVTSVGTLADVAAVPRVTKTLSQTLTLSLAL